MRSDAKGEEERKSRSGGRAERLFSDQVVSTQRGLIAQRLPIGHFLGHIQQQLAIFLVGFAQQAT